MQKMKKKNILIICYGGTIVMIVDRKKKSVVEAENINDIKEAINQIPSLNEKANIDIDFLEKKDSSNVSPKDWKQLSKYIAEKHRDKKVDGFVVTHGTNTMAYTASALSLSLGRGLQKPIIITGSQLPLEEYGTDARFNFENAILTASEAADKGYAEVMICFSDVILRGNRSVKVSESDFKAFNTPAFPQLGWIRSTGIIWNQAILEDFKANINNNLILKNNFCEDIISIDLIPGQNPNMLNKLINSNKCKGIILKSHGAGSVPTYKFVSNKKDKYNSYLEFIKGVTYEKKIPVIVATKFLGGNAYKEINDECAVEAIKNGAISGKDLTDVMTEVKLMWILGNGFDNIKEIKRKLHYNYVGEIG